MSSAVRDSDELMRSLQHISEESLSASDLANLINDSFLFPMQDFTPLSAETFQLPQDYSTAQPFAVTVHAVYLQLTSINPKKVSGPDGIPAWLLKENADLLSDTVTDIINCSFAESRLPPSWKSADTMPIPKQKPIKYINKHLCPISLTPVLCKVVEEFVVAQHLRPSILKKIGDNRFGAIPESSTMHALISMVHSWTKHTDDRTQRVKLGEDCLSEWRNVPAGVLQGTKLGPWLFILMIDDINTSNTELWKYVDDTTIAKCVDKKEDSRIQSDVEELIAKSNQNKFQLNESKCKEIRILFAKLATDFAPIVINGKAIEVVSTVKLLGLNISSDLRWNCHVAEISKKIVSRLYFLKQLKRANIPAKDLLIFYLTCICPVTEYACPVFHNALPAYLSAELEQLQKRAMRIIFPFVPYSDTLHQANLETLSRRRQSITTKLINSMSSCHLVTIVNPI
ncbi:uncharacterized protein [Porites lutea]|uniref:uncharacterized protein n=1 Tax=Porites lutea TaxID=51062 RepID=UPI003CC533B0